MSRDIAPHRAMAGGLSASRPRGWTGLRPGTPVAVANVDAHVSVRRSASRRPGRMVAVMGTSTCHLVLGDRLALAEGMCGVVEDGIMPGLFGYEAGQSAVGDIFAWFIGHGVPPDVPRAAAARGHRRPRASSSARPPRCRPGETGLVALDWWNGNRSILVDVDLSGLLLGATLATDAGGDLPRADRGDGVRHAA